MTDLKPTRLFLVRHGETEWNAAQVFQGHLDSNLTRAGTVQAERLAERLADEGVSAVYSSDQGRAMLTAKATADRLGLEVIPRQELREIDCGDWTGMSYTQVRAQWPNAHENWVRRPHLHCMPNGEDVAAVQRRAFVFLREAQRRHPGESVLAVTHNTIVRAVVCSLMGLDLDRLWEVPRQPNCGINLIEMVDGAMKLAIVADTSHLENALVSDISFETRENGGKVV